MVERVVATPQALALIDKLREQFPAEASTLVELMQHECRLSFEPNTAPILERVEALALAYRGHRGGPARVL